ncbi:Pre-mRNA-splicing factor SPF27 [Cichlidogyrus casuarinus]|uniref:Pre-mRNA-splicing factor SPF27 n=1 Tax=Cichlidogyrus casuarinus TaxID=1844966 RepID=A0ABD2QG07_9PLAT
MISENVIVDALPYVDKGYEEAGIQTAAALLVEEEMKRYRPTKNYLEHLPSLSGPLVLKNETDILKHEFDRLANRQPMDLLSMKRYELPNPPTSKLTDLKSWMESLNNAQAQLEHQSVRIENLQLMSEYGAEAWKNHNELLEKSLKKFENNLIEAKSKIQQLNLQRKREQTAAGQKLKYYEEQWVTLIAKNYEIERAIADLEKELNIAPDQEL